ncbi:MAG TPA: M20/M25/M40 family metallo-hydrolase [Clostridiales bacterium]|nr:M20/M25/M40 family metallo-hydrolase [Clostridiales bacterium]
MVVLYILLPIVIAFAAVILIRAAMFKPPEEKTRNPEQIIFDYDASITALQELIRCRTVSYSDPAMEDDAEFEKLIGLIPRLYPEVYRVCTLIRLPGRALLLKWEGTDHSQPSVLMSHYDVVPANEESWTKPPFDALIDENGIMWGRGCVDTKLTFNGIMFAANHLIAQGFKPKHDLYFAFSGSEEVYGSGAPNIVDWFEQQGISPAFVLDEGGAVVENVFPGVNQPCALIGVAEKGLMNLEFRVSSSGGHAASPKPHTPIGILSRACCRIENHPFKMHISSPVAEMFNTLGRHSTFIYRMIFANLWCFGGILDILSKKSGGEMNAMLRTTAAFTQAEGSPAPNVIPPSASFVANLRLNPNDSIDSAMEYIKRIVADENVQITVGKGAFNPSVVSKTHCPAWDMLAETVEETWPGCIVSPYLMVQCSDSRHYGRISNHVYRFSAADFTADEISSIHGNDEHIRVNVVKRTVEFYIRLMLKC